MREPPRAPLHEETLEVRFKGKSIASELEMSVEEALTFFAKIPKGRRRLQTLHDVGLDHAGNTVVVIEHNHAGAGREDRGLVHRRVPCSALAAIAA